MNLEIIPPTSAPYYYEVRPRRASISCGDMASNNNQVNEEVSDESFATNVTLVGEPGTPPTSLDETSDNANGTVISAGESAIDVGNLLEDLVRLSPQYVGAILSMRVPLNHLVERMYQVNVLEDRLLIFFNFLICVYEGIRSDDETLHRHLLQMYPANAGDLASISQTLLLFPEGVQRRIVFVQVMKVILDTLIRTMILEQINSAEQPEQPQSPEPPVANE